MSIRNFALIEAVSLEFERGFNVLTGETGAGKSILIDALTAALGERTGQEAVRMGADRATVEAVFAVPPAPPAVLCDAAEDGLIILAREIGAAGRSSFRINGRLATAGAVRELAAELIDIHGQHDHQSLLSPERHVDFLDAWAGPDTAALRGRVTEAHAALRAARRDLDALLAGERERARTLDLHRFELEEIDRAAPDAAEEATLAGERTRLANAERLGAGVAAARRSLDAGEPNAADLIALAARELTPLTALDSALSPAADLLETAAAAVAEASAALRAYGEQVEISPDRLEQVQDRLELYRQLKRKYGDTVEEVLAYRDRAAAALDNLLHSEERREALEERVTDLAAALDTAAATLHAARRAAAGTFEAEIAGHLADLNMAGTRFAVDLQPPVPAAEAAERGPAAALGRAEFLISANPGEPLRPLARIASGGEMSRVMLALKSAMAGSHPVALIFDEIDAGVGGKTADTLGEKMARLGRSNQVLCVTHLPQIAARADRHFAVEKQVGHDGDGERTTVAVARLQDAERVAEVARMLGGSEATAARHARELLRREARAGAALPRSFRGAT